MYNRNHSLARFLVGSLMAVVGLLHSSNVRAECAPFWGGSIGTPGLDGESGGTVYAMTTFDDGNGTALYVGGEFDNAGGISASNIAKWDGTSWSSLGSGIDGRVFILAVHDDGNGPALYAGGFFSIAGGVGANCIAKWDGVAWSPLGSGMALDVRALLSFDDGNGPALYAGGYFTSAGGVSAKRVAKWDGSTWSALGAGFNNAVKALAVYDDGMGPVLYAGGDFSHVQAPFHKRMARWNGTTWSPVGSGLGTAGGVTALMVFDDGNGPALYAGGGFGGTDNADNIAKWDGASWSPLGLGTNAQVYSLAVFDDGSGPALYAGGWFDQAGGLSANRIARWNGSAWSTLGSGMPEPGDDDEGIRRDVVTAVTVSNVSDEPALFAAGYFNSAGGGSSKNIARWSNDCSDPGPGDDTGSIVPDTSIKTRFISFTPTGATNETAIRVILDSLHHVVPPYTGGPSMPFTGFEGQVRWVGLPTQYVESSTSGIPFRAAQLQCTPHYQDWGTVGLLHVTGSAIVPSSTYGVESLAATCAGFEANCSAVSERILLQTNRWGDIALPRNPPSPTVQPDIADVSALVSKFRSAVGAPIKVDAILAGAPGNAFGEVNQQVLNTDIGFSHISACVDAFRGVPYPYTIQACP